MTKQENPEGCVASAAGPIALEKNQSGHPSVAIMQDAKMNIMVGTKAPDFEASAFHEGGFRNIKLSDYLGKWLFLCFYPGDFTFV